MSFHNLTAVNEYVLQFIPVACLSLGTEEGIHVYRSHWDVLNSTYRYAKPQQLLLAQHMIIKSI